MEEIKSSEKTYNPDNIEFKPEDYFTDYLSEDEPETEFVPKQIESDQLIISGPEYFHNYELSWLDFNFRVLEQAQNVNNPLLERVKFIGIVCSNLDEFFQKRVGGLKRQFEAGVNNKSVDGLKPLEQLKKIRKQVKLMIKAYRSCFFDELIPPLKEHGVYFKSYDELTKKEKNKVDHYFKTQLFPILTPLVVDQSHPFPFISNKSRSFAIEIQHNDSDECIFARVKIPNNRPRWFFVTETKKQCVLVNTDEIILAHINSLFPGATVKSAHLFRVTRNADLKRNEEEADDLLELIEEELRERRFAEVVRLELDAQTPEHVKQILLDQLDISKIDVYEMDGPIGLADCLELSKIKGFEHLKYTSWTPVVHPVLRSHPDEETPDIFSIIRNGDFMVHHPYHSFATSVQRFVEEASKDPKVLAIKQTLYRTSNDSPIMHALMRAAETGKQVAVLVELKARFDEQQNIDWALRLEKAGIHVSYGLPGLKIHSKITVVVREESGKLQRYAHIGTGNYHPGTANLYEDVGLFTKDDDLCADVSDVFNYLTGFAPNQKYRKLLVAPNYLRNTFTELIDFEINEAKNGRPSRIICKMNSLEDPMLIQKLYEASQAGVSIDMIVRGVCRLKPGIEHLSENIKVHSIIGRFLEHSRIFYFMHAGEDLFFQGSADIMHRNLDARVEVITPVEHPRLKTYLQFILFVCLRDNTQRWILEADGVYKKQTKEPDDYEVATHKILMHHTSQLREPLPKA
jgi:polyphosphate kinase